MALCRDFEPDSRFRSDGLEARCTLALADLTDRDALVRVLNEHEVDEVFHLGAQAIVGVANRSPLATWESNVRGTYMLLEACRDLGTVDRVVVASSDKAYGDHDELPYREDFALQPRYPYDVSKACTDLIARSYANTYGLRVAVTRLANVYGPGDVNWTRIVPDSARALARGERPVVRSDGTPERDFLYVEDAVDAYIATGASLDRPELNGRAWNAGWGRPVPVIDLVRTLIEVSGRDVEPDVRGDGTPHGEIDRQYLDSTAMREQLGWQPSWELERGLSTAWEWYERRCGTSP
ncbi:MAG: CDP-glucose 4,6-dehydratase [Thermoleophilaceae bacterium]|nr:CDP-glucose 4,6-dehydratase [Thermoleophilaceae bacterium]